MNMQYLNNLQSLYLPAPKLWVKEDDLIRFKYEQEHIYHVTAIENKTITYRYYSSIEGKWSYTGIEHRSDYSGFNVDDLELVPDYEKAFIIQATKFK